MIKTEKKEVKTFKEIKHVYCDKCGKEIATVEEDEFGNYPAAVGVFSSGIHDWCFGALFYPGGHFKLEGDYCRDCRSKIEDEVMEFFEKMNIKLDFEF